MIGPVRAGGAFEAEPAPPLAHGVECVEGLEGPADGPPRAGKAAEADVPDAPGTYLPLIPAVARGRGVEDPAAAATRSHTA